MSKKLKVVKKSFGFDSLPGEPGERSFEHFYTVREVAAILKVAERTVYNWVEFGYMKAIKVGSPEGKGTIRIPESALQEFIKKYTTIEEPFNFVRKR